MRSLLGLLCESITYLSPMEGRQTRAVAAPTTRKSHLCSNPPPSRAQFSALSRTSPLCPGTDGDRAEFCGPNGKSAGAAQVHLAGVQLHAPAVRHDDKAPVAVDTPAAPGTSRPAHRLVKQRVACP